MDGSDDNDPLEGLEERLNSHSRAFESLLALTPARDYYGSHVVDGQDPSEQWNRKKQTKEQKRAAKKAKLDPANQKSALDVMKEREAEALKRKRDDDDDDDAGDVADADESSKRQKSEEDGDAAEARRREKAEKKRESRMRKKERKDAQKAKAEAKKARRQEKALATTEGDNAQPTREEGENLDEDAPADGNPNQPNDMDAMDITGLADVDSVSEAHDVDDAASSASSAPSSPVVDDPAFDVGTNLSAASSSSSIIPPSVADHKPAVKSQPTPKAATAPLKKPAAESPPQADDPTSGTMSPKFQLPDIDHSILQERLRQRIAELRATRKADGAEGKPAKSRSELLEQRRKKEEQRKAAKKDQIRKTKDEERRKQEERLRGSGSPLSTDMFSPRSPQPRDNSFSFSRLAFEDGTQADPELAGLHEARKHKGPQDINTALQAAQNKQARLAGYDAEKRADIAEKDMWINAKKRAHGERVRDDTSLLKKALKRKEKQKSKSEVQWKEREQAVVKGKEMKQKKRETNLQKRKDDKGAKGKKKGPNAGGKKKARPGFEGRFKA